MPMDNASTCCKEIVQRDHVKKCIDQTLYIAAAFAEKAMVTCSRVVLFVAKAVVPVHAVLHFSEEGLFVGIPALQHPQPCIAFCAIRC